MRAPFLLLLMSLCLTLGVVAACSSSTTTTDKVKYIRDGRHFGGGNN